MKKIFLFIIASLVSLHVGAQINHEVVLKKSKTIVITGGETIPSKTRSAISPVSAYLDFDMEQIEISFTLPIGSATLYITNSMGQVISCHYCDSNIESFIYLPIPTNDDVYTLKIVSGSTEYIGTFTI